MSRSVTTAIIALGVLILIYGVVMEVSNSIALPLPEGELEGEGAWIVFVDSGAAQDAIPSVDNPSFVSVNTADNYLSDDGYGLDVDLGGEHRFYPYQILVWHEIVNAVQGDAPIAVTYDPLCGSGAVYERDVAGTTYDFGTSGKLWNNNFLLYDRQTNSLWSQILGTAVDGQLKDARLARVASSTMLWSDWKTAHPDGLVLSRSTGAIRDYTSNPYGDYANNLDVYFPLSVMDNSRPIKEVVTGSSGETMYWFCWAALRSGEVPI